LTAARNIEDTKLHEDLGEDYRLFIFVLLRVFVSACLRGAGKLVAFAGACFRVFVVPFDTIDLRWRSKLSSRS